MYVETLGVIKAMFDALIKWQHHHFKAKLILLIGIVFIRT